MSARLLGIGFSCDMGTPCRKLVLLKLIDACEDDGSRIFPAVETIARAAQCSMRQVQRELAGFVQVGLLRVVREGGRGPGSTREYAMSVDMLKAIEAEGFGAVTAGLAEPDKGDTVSPLGAGAKGDTDDAKGDTGDAKGDIACHPTPQDPSRYPSVEREARAGEREAGQPQAPAQGGAAATGPEPGTDRGDDGSPPARAEAPDEPPEATDDPPEATDIPGRAAFEKRVMWFCNGRGFAAGAWKDWDTSSPGHVGAMFARLSPDERREAERWRDAYLLDMAARDRKPVPVANFLRDRMWSGLDPAILERAERQKAAALKPEERARPDGWAPCLGPVGMAWLVAAFLRGPADAGLAGRAFLNDALLRQAWPHVWNWQALQRQRGGNVFAPRWHALKGAMEFVPHGTEIMAGWKAAFEARGWRWLNAFDAGNGLWLPAGGPDGLDGFEKALAAAGDEAGGEDGTDDDAAGRTAAE